MRYRATILLAAGALSACQPMRIPPGAVQGNIDAELKRAAQAPVAPATPQAVSQALLPPLTVEMPSSTKPVEPHFDLAVNNAPANQVFMALVSGTRYSMLVHPDIKESVSINLKDVTLTEALEALREVYGYEYRIQGTRIYIEPVTMQTQLFQVNYLAGRRTGRAEVRVSSGSIQNTTGSVPASQGVLQTAAAAIPSGTSQALESSRVTTSQDNDFWNDVQSAIRTIVGSEGGRNVVVNANAGVIMVRAMPKELRAVEQYLKATSLVVERQVMLEAKIIEVSLSDQFSTGINWAGFRTGPNSRLAGGVISPGTTLRTDGSVANSTLLIDPTAPRPLSPDPLTGLTGTLGSATSLLNSVQTATNTVFGLAFQTGSFAALLNFLESQGGVQVLSSPRIATLNNQKAVIKVGTDEFFVTNVTTTTTAAGNTTTVSPTITTQPFFSGIALDVTPQISDADQITLHIHPSVSEVTDKTKVVNLGTLGTFTLPLASSNINESDTIVRVQNGTIAAIGGLMRQRQSNNRSGLPGTSGPILGTLFGSRDQQLTKSELVILLKVTVIRGDAAWQQEAQQLNERMLNLRPVNRENR
ncbi:MAG: mannose-sensitive hemagglutinin [Betaproteobacteria bacterium]|jgi:MSHA biogenesis protein MshL|nr:mannose-sensitive hemagglutinin [Betaproteobacteria bacterium]